MDSVTFLSSLVLLGLSMCFTPGPNNALVMAIGLDRGFRAALPFCFGAGVGANVTLVLLGFGLGEVFIRFPLVYDFLRYAGAAYMLWLAWKISGLRVEIFRKKSEPVQVPDAPESADGGRGAASAGRKAAPTAEGKAGHFTFSQAFVFQLLNVKVWLTNIIIVSNYVGTGDDRWLKLALCVVLFTAMGTSAMCCWAAGGSFLRRFLASDGMRRANYVFASFLMLSIVLLFA